MLGETPVPDGALGVPVNFLLILVILVLVGRVPSSAPCSSCPKLPVEHHGAQRLHAHTALPSLASVLFPSVTRQSLQADLGVWALSPFSTASWIPDSTGSLCSFLHLCKKYCYVAVNG